MKTNKNLELSQLTQQLKNEDVRYALISKSFQITYWILMAVYAVLIILHIIEKEPLTDIFGASCFLISMLIFALFFKNYYKEYNNVDYSAPTLIMLKKAAYRYQPFQRKTIWLLPALLFMDAGLYLNSSLNFKFWSIQLIYGGLLLIAICIGLIIWYVKYKPLRDNSLRLINEIEETEE